LCFVVEKIECPLNKKSVVLTQAELRQLFLFGGGGIAMHILGVGFANHSKNFQDGDFHENQSISISISITITITITISMMT